MSNLKKTPVVVQGKNGPHMSTRMKKTGPDTVKTLKKTDLTPSVSDVAYEVKTLLQQDVGVPVKSGYIGNTGPGYDDRQWHIWFDGVKENGSPNDFAIDLGSTEDALQQLALIEQNPEIVKEAFRKASERKGFQYGSSEDWNGNTILTADDTKLMVESYMES